MDNGRGQQQKTLEPRLVPEWDHLTAEEQAEMAVADGDLRSAAEECNATLRRIFVRMQCGNRHMRRNRAEIRAQAETLRDQAKVLMGLCG